MATVAARGTSSEVLPCQPMDPHRQFAGAALHRASVPPPGHTVATLHHAFREAMRRGVPAGELRALTGIDPADTEDFARRVTMGQLFDAWEAVMRRVDDPAFPVHAGASTLRDQRSPVTFLAQACDTVGDAFAQAAAYTSAFSTGYALQAQRLRGGCALILDGLGTTRLGERCEAEFMLADMVATLRAWVPDAAGRFTVHFRHSAPSGSAAHRQLFGAGLAFDQPRTEVLCDGRTAVQPLPTAQPGLAAFLRSSLDEWRRPHVSPSSFALRVRAVVLERLDDRSLCARTAASALAVSERTLHRWLAAEGASFRVLVDETRRHLAAELVRDPQLTTRQIASMLGFSSARSFHRAYVRWNGSSPRGRGRLANDPEPGRSTAVASR